MDRRLLLLLLVTATTASSLSDDSKKDTGTCSATEKKCGAEAPPPAPKKKKAPIDISVMWKKPDPSQLGHYYDEERYDGKVAQAVLAKLEKNYRVLEERCSQYTGVCYEVVDRVWRNTEGSEVNKWEMIRQVQLKGDIESHFGRAVLIKPKELNWKTYDTKTWKVNKYAVIDREIQALIGGITGSKAIPKNETLAAGRDYQILLIGLGTPIIPNFIEQYHWMDMIVIDNEPLFLYFAGRWFGMRRHPNLRFLRADPVSFMNFVVTQRHEVDALIINKCKDYSDARHCPADVFLERSTIEMLKNVVKEETGMLGVNTRSSVKKHEKDVARAYESGFPMCFDYPGEHRQLHFERYKSTICFNREHAPFWLGPEREFSLGAHHNWFFYV